MYMKNNDDDMIYTFIIKATVKAFKYLCSQLWPNWAIVCKFATVYANIVAYYD